MQKVRFKLTLHYRVLKRRWHDRYADTLPSSDIKTILIGATTLLGDLMITAPLIAGVKQSYPHARVTILVRKGFADLAKCIHGVDDAVEFAKKDYHGQQHLFHNPKLKADLGIIAFEPLLIPYFYAWGVKTIRSFPDPKQRYRYMIHEPVALPVKATYMTAMLTEQLLNGRIYKKTTPFLTLSADSTLPTILRGKRYAILHVGASRPAKVWPKERYAAIADYLQTRGLHVVFTGTSGEATLIEQVISHIHNRQKIINLAGRTNLLQLAQVVQQAEIVIAPDTGVMHLSRCLDVKSICLLGGSSQIEIYGLDKRLFDPKRYQILYVSGLSCRDTTKIFGYQIPGVQRCTRYACPLPSHPCMQGATIQDVIKKINMLVPTMKHKEEAYIC